MLVKLDHIPKDRVENTPAKQKSEHEKKTGCLGCIGDYTTQLYGDFKKPI